MCGLSFKVTLPSRIPTSYAVLVNRVPRECHVDSMKPLIAQRYLSTVQVARILHDAHVKRSPLLMGFLPDSTKNLVLSII
jgi:hypothetical protein